MHDAKKKKNPPRSLVSILGEERATMNCVKAGHQREVGERRVVETNLTNPLHSCGQADSKLLDACGEYFSAINPNHSIPRH